MITLTRISLLFFFSLMTFNSGEGLVRKCIAQAALIHLPTRDQWRRYFFILKPLCPKDCVYQILECQYFVQSLDEHCFYLK